MFWESQTRPPGLHFATIGCWTSHFDAPTPVRTCAAYTALTSLRDRGTDSQTCPIGCFRFRSSAIYNSNALPEKGEKLALKELGSALAVGFSGNLGKYTNGLIAQMIGSRMPILLLGTAMEPPKRLSSEPEAKAWLDSGVAIYGQRSGITLSAGASSGGGGRVGSGDTFNSEEF